MLGWLCVWVVKGEAEGVEAAGAADVWGFRKGLAAAGCVALF